MKKIIAMAVTAVLLVSATFALNFEVGARGILGRNLDGGSVSENFAAALQDKTFDFGFGAYANLSILGGLGVQAEANYVKSSITFTGNGNQNEYSMHILDLSPMLWLNLDLWKFEFGFGAGPNFEIPLASLSDITTAKKEDFTVGLIAGVDVKFYFTKHLGVVASGRFVCDFNKREIPIEVFGHNSGGTYPSYELTRKTLYGGLGLEFRLFE